ncbi:MAG: choice-of-anchor B family protein, partial [Gemmatimonadota bacterium]|nr:choice-of-anchor B family protein [Gemmatimonadota bacterium]
MRLFELLADACSVNRSRSTRLVPVFAVTAVVVAASVSAAMPTPAASQAFGGAVLIAGDYILVGEAAHEREPGTVWVFARDGEEWTRVAALRSDRSSTGDCFGKSLAHAGDFVWIGADGMGGGMVYAYRLQEIGSGKAVEEWPFGVSHGAGVADPLAGYRSDLMVTMAGRVGGMAMHMYRVGAEAMDVSQTGEFIVPRSPGPIATTPVALAGNLLAIGNPGQDAVQLYERPDDGGQWESTAVLTPPDGTGSRSFFGSSVAVGGGEILVGQMRGGVVHRYEKVDGTWQSAGTLEAPDEETSAGFGQTLAADGETLLVGGALRFFAYRRYAGGWMSAGASPLYNEDGTPARTTLSLSGQLALAADPSADFGMGAVLVYSNESGEWVRSGRLVAEHAPLPAITGGEIACDDGEAADYDCDHVDLLSFLPREEIGAARGARLNDIWGWTDPQSGREYALVGRMDGTSFVDVTDAYNPRYLGNLARTDGSPPSTWRDIKVFKDHAFIVADGAGEHGMQVFDLTGLRDVTEPREFEATAMYTGIASSHNVAINENTGFAYLVGSSGGGETCGGGSHIVDINDPLNPVFAGCFAHENTGRSNTGNSHDTQCVIYHGPDEDYRGREICVNSNENALSVADVTDKDNPIAVAKAAYPNVSYAHQGWLTEDHRYFYSNDETDELAGLVEATRTLIWDLADLDDPVLIKEYFSPTKVTDHNLYVKGDRLYMSNNRAGLRVLDI